MPSTRCQCCMTCPQYVRFSAPCNSTPSFRHPILLRCQNRYTISPGKLTVGHGDQKRKLKELLATADVLFHFDPSLPLGFACDASAVGTGATYLFHRYPGGSERPITNISKTLAASQCNYSHIQKESLAIIYGLQFFQYLHGKKFILVTDHQLLVAMLGPNKPTGALTANRFISMVPISSTIQLRRRVPQHVGTFQC